MKQKLKYITIFYIVLSFVLLSGCVNHVKPATDKTEISKTELSKTELSKTELSKKEINKTELSKTELSTKEISKTKISKTIIASKLVLESKDITSKKNPSSSQKNYIDNRNTQKENLVQLSTSTYSNTIQNSTKKTVSTLKANSKYVIAIDAGHQKTANTDLEPIGPGATKKKPKVSSGTQGIKTKVPEYKVNLQVALKLRDILEKKGYQVVMIRETNDVNLSNAERAQIANKNKADAFIRIHCNGSENTGINGALTMCPTKNNPYIKSIYKDSRKLSEYVLNELCKSTDAKKNNIIESDSMSGINWSKVPVTIVEMGYMTNVKEDKNLTTDTYQDKLAKGIANGIVKYLKD